MYKRQTYKMNTDVRMICLTTDMFSLSKHQMRNSINVSLAFLHIRELLTFSNLHYVLIGSCCSIFKFFFSVSRTSFYRFVVFLFYIVSLLALMSFIGLIFPLMSLLPSLRTNKLIYSCHSFYKYRWVAYPYSLHI